MCVLIRNPWCDNGALASRTDAAPAPVTAAVEAVAVGAEAAPKDKEGTKDVTCLAGKTGVSVTKSLRDNSGGRSFSIVSGARMVDCNADGIEALYNAKLGYRKSTSGVLEADVDVDEEGNTRWRAREAKRLECWRVAVVCAIGGLAAAAAPSPSVATRAGDRMALERALSAAIPVAAATAALEACNTPPSAGVSPVFQTMAPLPDCRKEAVSLYFSATDCRPCNIGVGAILAKCVDSKILLPCSNRVGSIP